MNKAMILAAGKGERMRPLTEHTPKPLLNVAGSPLIVHHINKLSQNGFNDIIINCSWLGEQIPAALGDGSAYGVKLTYSMEHPVPFETAGGIQKALPFFEGRPFLLVNGDVWTDIDFSEFAMSGLKHLQNNALAYIALVDNPQHNCKGDFHLFDTQVSNHGDNMLTYSGIGLYHPRMFESLSPGITPLGPMLRNLATSKQLSGEHHKGKWVDVGTPQRLQDLEQELT